MRYRLSIPEPHTHLLHVEATLDRPGPAPELAFPVWTPGSYLVREFARHVEGLAAADGDGRPLPIVRLDKHRFRVLAGEAGRVVVTYRVYANELTVRTCHVDGTHAYLNGAAVFPYAAGREREPHALEIAPPPGWSIATALEGGPTSFAARDYDTLADSPVEIGTHRVARFTALGKPHEIAIWGKGSFDAERLARDVAGLVETLGGLMGGLPYERYLFVLHVTEKRRGGLEHATSTTLDVGRNGFFPREAYEETLGLFAHEFFHLWNVKRLRPAALTPYDYAREQYTRLLWWFEGATSYYENLALARAGITEPKRLLERLGRSLTTLERTPGARKMTVEEASFLAWVKHYRPDENSVNSAISYYLKGELVVLALDLALRRAGSSLDGLLGALYARHLEQGMPEDGVEAAVSELLGADAARAFFDRHVRGTEPLALDLELVGLRLRRRSAQGFDDRGGTPPRPNGAEGTPGWLGAELAVGPRLVVTAVREGSPAHRAGIYAEDEIIAEEGFRIDGAALWDRLREKGPAGTLRLTVFRRDELVEVPVRLAPPPEDTVWLEPVEAPSAAQREAFRAWSGLELPGSARSS
jgi:predicted metalloprotease with PDZ domain